jgi:hypothetical protein
MRKIYLMSLSLILTFMSMNFGTNAQVVFTESFDGTTFPPTGWLNIHTIGTNANAIWERAIDGAALGDDINGLPANINTHSGLGMATFRSYDFAGGNGANLISSVINLTTYPSHLVKFWMYRDPAYTNQDSISVYINTSASPTGARFLGKIIRNIAQPPTAPSAGWYEYSFPIPSNYNTASNYLIFSAVSRFGNNLFIDDVQVANNPVCSGTPNSGTASTSVSTLCGTGNASLSLGGFSSSNGITLQWQSSPAGANTFTNIATATTPTYVATVTASTDYRCVVTCSNGGASSISNVVNVTIGGVPSNDLICNATTVIANGAEVCGNTTCATTDATDSLPACARFTANNTVWFKFTPPANGQYRLIMNRPAGVASNQSLSAWVGIFTAASTCPSPGTLTEIVSPNCTQLEVISDNTDTTFTGQLTAGVTYYIIFDGQSGSFGQYCFKITDPPTAPVCVTNISPINGATNVSVYPAQLSWNASPTATSYNVFIGTSNPPTGTLSNPVSGTSVNVTGLPNSTLFYWYVVPNNGVAATGCVTNVTSFTTQALPLPPANDSCGAATVLTNGVANAGTTISASQSLAPTVCASFTATGPVSDVWYSVTALSNGALSVASTTTDGSYDGVLFLYSGVPGVGCAGLTELGCADATGSGGNETINFPSAVAGTTYYVRAYDYAGQGTFTITASGPALPISLLSFTGIKQDKTNLLNWATASETNNKGFELQRSANGNDFTSIAFVNSKAIGGNSSAQLNYSFSDITPLGGTNYYRLKQVDKDGKFSMSKVVAIKGLKPTSLQLVGVYPNPAVNKLNVNIESPVVDFVTLVVTDMTGKVLMNKMKAMAVGDNNVELNVSTLPAGSYFIKAVCANGCETTTAKFVKQ